MKRHEELAAEDVGEDPSSRQGFEEILQTEILVRIQESQEDKKIKQLQDWILLRLFVTKSRLIKIELTSEVDLLFFYSVSTEWENLESELKSKDIQIKFSDLSTWWTSILGDKNTTFTFQKLKEFNGVLSIDQKLDYKTINVLNIVFLKSPHEALKENIMYRYRRMTTKKSMLSNILLRANQLIKVKNPSLLYDKPKPRHPQKDKHQSKQKQKQFRFT